MTRPSEDYERIAAAYQPHPAPSVGHAKRVRCDVDYWSTDLVCTPPEGYMGKHTPEAIGPGMCGMVRMPSGKWILVPF